MQDIQLYQQILGSTEPWHVESVRLDPAQQVIEVQMALKETNWACPDCRKRMQIHDCETRRWRHLDSCQFQTILVAKVPRVRCSEHGSQTVQVPWAEKHGRFTALFERLAIDVLKEMSIEGARKLLRLSWAEAAGIKDRAVARGLARREAEVWPHLCVDEKAVGRGQDYLTVVSRRSPDGVKVVWLGDGNSKESLDAFWPSLTDAQRQGVEAVSMDMWKAFASSTRQHVPHAEIIYDFFHLVRHVNRAVNLVRQKESARLHLADHNPLKGTRQLWLYGMENVPEKARESFKRLWNSNLKTARAWHLKEVFRTFTANQTPEEGRLFLRQWIARALRSRLDPMRRVARMVRSHLEGIVAYCRHLYNNACAEGLNSLIQFVVAKARGFRNRQRLKMDLFFHFGGLNLYPAKAQ